MCAHAGRINAETQGGGERERERSYPRGAEKALSIADHRRPNSQHTLLKTLKPFMHVRAILSVNEATAYIPESH